MGFSAVLIDPLMSVVSRNVSLEELFFALQIFELNVIFVYVAHMQIVKVVHGLPFEISGRNIVSLECISGVIFVQFK